MTMVKICGLTNLEDARWAAACGADLLGFIFVPATPRYVERETAAAIMRDLRAEGYRCRFVGVFADAEPDTIRRTVTTCDLDLVQLHGQESPEAVSALGVPVIRATRVREQVDWPKLVAWQSWAYLFDTYDPHRLGGTGHPWRWELLGNRPPNIERVIVAGGLTPDNVALAIRQAHPWGVDVSSGVEATPGHKNPSQVERFIRIAKEECEQ